MRRAQDESASAGLRILLHGRESYPFEVVGSARRQAEIRAMVGHDAGAVRRHKRVAVLSEGQAEGSAGTNVSVSIGGVTVGHFPRYLTTQYREWLRTWSLSHASVHCQALILRDGHGADAGEYRVKLDIEMPFKMTTLYV